MDPRLRIVVAGPLTELWDDDGPVNAERVRHVSREEARQLIRDGLRTFVVADIGSHLVWKRGDDALNFWQAERQRVADPESAAAREDYPGEYFWWASEWKSDHGAVLLFEKEH